VYDLKPAGVRTGPALVNSGSTQLRIYLCSAFALLLAVLPACHHYQQVTIKVAEPDGQPVCGIDVLVIPCASKVNYPRGGWRTTDARGQVVMQLPVNRAWGVGLLPDLGPGKRERMPDPILELDGRFRHARSAEFVTSQMCTYEVTAPYVLSIHLRDSWAAILKAETERREASYGR
jgi:hypothetical protein